MTAPGNAESTPAATPATGAPALPQASATPAATPAPAPAAAPAPAPAQKAVAPAAPPKAPAAPAKAKSSGAAATGAYVLAVFALIIAVAAAAGAAYAIKLGWDNRDKLASPQPSTSTEPEATQTQTQPAPTGSATFTGSATPTASRSTTPAVVYTPELVRAALTVPTPTGCNSAYVDVDTLVVGTDAGHEFYLSRCQDPQTLQIRVDKTSGRSSSGANPSAETCASLVAGTPTTEMVLDAKAGTTFCLLTNKSQASSQSLPQRLAIVEVLNVSTTQVQFAVSTYRVP